MFPSIRHNKLIDSHMLEDLLHTVLVGEDSLENKTISAFKKCTSG